MVTQEGRKLATGYWKRLLMNAGVPDEDAQYHAEKCARLSDEVAIHPYGMVICWRVIKHWTGYGGHE